MTHDARTNTWIVVFVVLKLFAVVFVPAQAPAPVLMMSAPTERNPLLRRRAAAAAAPTNSSASAQGASRGAAHDVGSVVGRTVLITGANTGIGFQSARALAQQGAHVVMACRNEQRGTEAARRIAALVADDIGGEPGSAGTTRGRSCSTHHTQASCVRRLKALMLLVLIGQTTPV